MCAFLRRMVQSGFLWSLLAIILRMFFSERWPTTPVWDGQFYVEGAQNIAHGHGYGSWIVSDGEKHWWHWSHYPVGYAFFLSLVFRIIPSLHGARIFNALIGGVLTYLAFAVTRRQTVRSDGLLKYGAHGAACAVCLHPSLIMYSSAYMSELLTSCFLMLCVFFVFHPRLTVRRTILAGLSLSFAVLTRPNWVLLMPFFVFFVVPFRKLQRRETRKQSVVIFFAAILSATLPCALWTVRNMHYVKAPSLSTNGGWNLLIGARPQATGAFAPIIEGENTAYAHCDKKEDAARDRCYFQAAVKFVQQEPLRFIQRIPKKLHHTFDHEWAPANILSEGNQTLSRYRIVLGQSCTILFHALGILFAYRALRAFARPMTSIGISFGVTLFAYVCGPWSIWPTILTATMFAIIAQIRTRNPLTEQFAYHLMVFVTMLSSILFFGDDRYHLILVVPFICALFHASSSASKARNRCSS